MEMLVKNFKIVVITYFRWRTAG